MNTPVLALLSVSSTRIKDLRETVVILKKCLRRIRARVVFRPVRAGVGSIEVSLARNLKRWNTHAHIVLDARGLDVGEVERQWEELVYRHDRRTGTFGVEPIIKDERALAVYIAKHDSWCPRPCELPLWKLGVLLAATRGLRIAIEWGFRRKRTVIPPGKGSTR